MINIIKANNNTKREIKEAASRMEFRISMLNTNKTKKLIEYIKEDAFYEQREQAICTCTATDKKMETPKSSCSQGTQIIEIQTNDHPTKQKAPTTSQGTQTMENDILTEIKTVNNYGDFNMLANKRWSSELFKNTQVKEGNSLGTKDLTVKIVLVGPEDPNMDKGINAQYKTKYREIVDIKDNLGAIESTCVYRKIGHPDKQVTTTKVIKLTHNGTEQDIFNLLLALKEEVAETEWLAVDVGNTIAVRCYLEKKLKVGRCSKCWDYGHNMQQCNGTDRTVLCYNCGESGHDRYTCTMKNIVLYVIQKDIEQAQANVTYFENT